MSDNEQQRKSVAPISVPEGFNPKEPAVSNKRKERSAYRRQQRRQNRQYKGALNLRRVFTGLLLLALITVGGYCILEPETLPSVFSGQVFDREQTCTVTATNSSNQFDTSCGRFNWDEATLSGSPAEKLVEGEQYRMKSTGIRFPLSGTYPTLKEYSPL